MTAGQDGLDLLFFGTRPKYCTSCIHNPNLLHAIRACPADSSLLATSCMHNLLNIADAEHDGCSLQMKDATS